MEETVLVVGHYAALIVLSGVVPMACAVVWALMRPDHPSVRRERELVRRLAEEDIYGGERCLDCRLPVEEDWLRCPSCAAQLHARCECGAVVELYWSACPWCTRELGAVEPLPEPEHVPADVADADLAHRPRPVGGLVEGVGAAAA